jgi:glutaryl-CoA dehydrogenase
MLKTSRSEKKWIGDGTIAVVVVVWARDDEGTVGVFLVEKGTPGFSTEVMTGKAAMSRNGAG